MVARGAGGVTAEHAESVPCNTHRGWPLALRCRLARALRP